MGRADQLGSDPQKKIVTERDIPASRRPGSSVDDVTPISAEGFGPLEVRKRVLHSLIRRAAQQPVQEETVDNFSALYDVKQFLSSNDYDQLRNMIANINGGLYYGALLQLESEVLAIDNNAENATLSEETQSVIRNLFNILCQTKIFSYQLTATFFSYKIIDGKKRKK